MTHIRWDVHATRHLEDLLGLLAAVGHKILILSLRAQHRVAHFWANRAVRHRVNIFDVEIFLTFLEVGYGAGHFMLGNLVSAKEFIHEIHHVLKLRVDLLEVFVKIILEGVVRMLS